jgi:hypothetical protein
VVSLALSACWRGQIPYDSPGDAPAAADLAGTWRATAASLSDYAAVGLPRYATADAHSIELRADGTCFAHTLFGATSDRQPVEPSMRCDWRVIDLPHLPLVELTVTTGAGQVYQQNYMIGDDDGALVLYDHLAQPDAERYAELSRNPAAKPRRRTMRCS